MSTPSNISSNSTIAKNTILLYIRMAIVMFINIYAVRVLYNALGTADYGIYNVTAGVVSLLAFITGVLSMSTQRYFSVAIGEHDAIKSKNIFSSSINIFILLSVIILLIGETIGLWFVYNKLGIPHERLDASIIIYHFALLSFIISLFQIPYTADMIAHEDMGLYALLTTIECILKLLAALSLLIFSYDKLITYGAVLCFAHIISFFLFLICGRINYPECRYAKVTDKALYGEFLTFSGWTLFGSVANVGMIQGNTILMNIFFGPIITAARSISLQIYNAISVFCNSFVTAIRPPMIKTYTEGEYGNLLQLFNVGNKFIYYFMLMICLPLFLEMDTILNLWLGQVDINTTLFSRLMIIYTMIISLHNPITIIIQATGKVKSYYLPVELFTLLTVPLTYLFFKLGFPAQYTFWIMISLGVVSHCVRLFCLKKVFPIFDIENYITDFVCRALIITIISTFSLIGIQLLINHTILRLIGVSIFSILFVLLISYTLGLSKHERNIVNKMVLSYIHKA